MRTPSRSNQSIAGWIVMLMAFVSSASAQETDVMDAFIAEPGVLAGRYDLDALGRVAAHVEGRLRTLHSHAARQIKIVRGPDRDDDPPPLFTYLDMMFRAHVYAERDIIFVKNKLIRSQITRTLEQDGAFMAAPGAAVRLERFLETGRIAESILRRDDVLALLRRLEQDLIRSAKFVDQIEFALISKEPDRLRSSLRIVPPPNGDATLAWISIDEMLRPDIGAAAGFDAEVLESLRGTWRQLVDAWVQGDTQRVNEAALRLASILPAVEPSIYPDSNRLAWEHWYFRAKNMTWVWILYAFTAVPLLLSIVFRWRGAYWLGFAMFILAFGLHTFAVMLRWYVAERWPNTNMFEAVTTSTWFGGCFAVLFEIYARRGPMRSIVMLGSAIASMVAMMATRLWPLHLDSGIENMMPVLHDLWLYIHTNVIIFSYVLIFITAISAMLYLFVRVGRALRGEARGLDEYARVGGAASLIMTSPEGGSMLTRRGVTLGQVLDGTTMVMMELSFVLLWAGIVMGAIWADHSWGRPWGWDPKEVFALNTFIVFAVLIHVRLTAKDKGLWTAVIALVGAVVMLFNWIFINFIISGLHSYA